MEEGISEFRFFNVGFWTKRVILGVYCPREDVHRIALRSLSTNWSVLEISCAVTKVEIRVIRHSIKTRLHSLF